MRCSSMVHEWSNSSVYCDLELILCILENDEGGEDVRPRHTFLELPFHMLHLLHLQGQLARSTDEH